TGSGLVYLTHKGRFTLKLRLRGARRGTKVDVRADIDGHAAFEDTHTVTTGKGGRAELEIEIEPSRRGDVVCNNVWLRWAGPFGLVERAAQRPTAVRIAVAPNIHAVKAAAMQWARSKTLIAGLKRQRYIGDGSEFESLKEFQAGYDPRAID